MKQARPKATLLTGVGKFLLKQPKKETTSTSATPQVTRAGAECEAGCDHGPKWKSCVKKAASKNGTADPYAVCTANVGQKNSKRESAKFGFTGRIREASQSQPGDGRRFNVTLIQEGLGNLGDCYYYTKDAIESMPGLYEGKKFFVDHPTRSEEEEHPERSVKDVAGYFENLRVDTAEDGRHSLAGDVVLINGPSVDHFRSLMLEEINYSRKHPDKSLVGLSINANGDFDTVPLDEFLKSEQIPESCLPKLKEAQAQGVTQIKPVREMKSAFSCDLVTEPGAGGAINSLLEGAKMAKQAKQEEEELKAKKEAAEAGDGEGDADGKDGDAKGGDEKEEHDDAAQDKVLISQQLKKHLGLDDDKEPSEEEASAMHMAYEESKAMGMEHEEAMKCAGYNLKMAKHMMSKQEESDGKDQGASAFAPKPKAVGDAGKVPSKEQVESNKHRDVKLTAEVARLRGELDAMLLKEFTEVSLRESKLPMSATKKLRECLKGVKTKKEVSEKLEVFKEAYRLGGEADGGGFILSAEKTTVAEDSEGLDFADCIQN